MTSLHYREIAYTTTIGSDLGRDGFFAELYRVTDGVRVFVAEAFWADATSNFSVTVVESPIPFSVLEAFLAEARLRLPPSAKPQETNLFKSGVATQGV